MGWTSDKGMLIEALKKSPAERGPKDLDVIYSFLHSLESLSSIRELALREICKQVRYESHSANDILYRQGDLNACWFILISGSVFIDGYMFLPRNSFGKRQAGCSRRPNECLILEPSEMIAIDYPNVHLMKPSSQHAPAAGPPIERILALDSEARRMRHARHHSDGSTDQLPAELHSIQAVLQQHDHHLHHRAHPVVKRNSRASDTSSAYSGSDMMQSSAEDGEMDLSGLGLVESLVDSDDEEGYSENNESLIVRDTVRECLEKDPAERTEDDIETLLEFMQHLPAFANMTLPIRRELCAVMVFAVVEKMGTIVMNDGEELDSWSVILNGHVEIERPDSTIEHLHMGDSFGITPTMEKLYHKGRMRTKMDDCQFVCIAQSDYYRILHKGEENTKRHTESGEVVLVTEHRILDGGNRKGHIVIRGTPERLMTHLVEEHSSVDPTYVEDLLLTYRTFLKAPDQVAEKLLTWFHDPKIRDRVTRVVLLWVNNHFNDFETETSTADFLENFEKLLDQERMGGQLRLLNIACAAKARPRNVVLTRAKRDEILHFSVLGGIERNCGIFISKVEKSSKAHEAGLKRGDQILEVNNQNFEHIAHNRALEILRGTTHLSITVKSNLLGFSEMLMSPDNSPRTPNKKGHNPSMSGTKQRLSVPDLESSVQPVMSSQPRGTDKKGFMSTGHRAKIRKALMRFNFMPGPRGGTSDPQLTSLDDSVTSYTLTRKGSSSSNNSSPIHTPHLSASNPDLSSAGQYLDDRGRDYPEHVIRVYRADQTCKYFLIHRDTTAREVVMLALQEFGITDPSQNYSLCEVSAEQEGLIKQKRLPDQMTCLSERIGLTSRYYLRNNLSTEPLVPDELASELTKDNTVTFLQLNSSEVAAQLTLRDFQLFHEIEPTEYIDDLFELNSKFGTSHLESFSKLVNQEMFWVVSEVCGEPNVVKRMKIIKQFIKIARHCKECKNFNSMFAIISGLGHGCVSRLRTTWEKLPTKYAKTFEDLQDLMDPSRNMSKYRNLVNSEMVQPPMIPFFPVVKKDLTFIHLGNDSKVDGLINFEKLRMIAKEIRHICNMASAQYDLANMLIGGGNSQSVFSAFSNINASAMATMRRKRRVSTLPNPKKMYEEAQMVRRVKSYLSTMVIVDQESRLMEMSHQCEPPAPKRIRDPSPNPAAMETKTTINVNSGPKFGTESPQAVRKLMSLSDKVRPHNSKLHTLPGHHTLSKPGSSQSPGGTRRPLSPRHTRPPPAPAVHLSSESSSLVSLGTMTLRKSTTANSVGSNESASPTNSIGSYQQQYETDSGHNSIASSNYDSHSTSSIGSSSSPPSQKRHTPTAGAPLHQPPPAPSCRPPLPPYHVVVQNSSAYSQYLQHQYAGSREAARARPPLPDYQSATQAQRARGKYGGRANSHEGALGYYNDDSDNNEELDDDDSGEEIVSAV